MYNLFYGININSQVIKRKHTKSDVLSVTVRCSHSDKDGSGKP